MRILGKQNLAEGLRNDLVNWQPLTDHKREMRGLSAQRPCSFLPQGTWPKMLPLVAHTTCLSQVLCWPWALKSVLNPPPLPSGYLTSPRSQSSQLQKWKRVRCSQSGGGEDFAIKLLIKKVPT